MKVVYIFREEWEKEYVEKALPDVQFSFREGCVQDYPNLTDEDAEGLVVFVKSEVGADVLKRFPNLKFVATRSTGFDHIDLTETKQRGVVVMNVPTYGENTVAEHAFALLLALSRKVYDAYNRVREEGSFSQDGLRGFDLSGKTVGVVGTGAIGKNVVQIAHGFDMRILAFDVSEDKNLVEQYGATYVSLENLLASSDVVTLHVPYTKHTYHLINTDTVGMLKKGMYLINTSRGPVVETDALVRGLKDGVIAGAGLDVLEEEGDTMAEDDTELLLDKHPSAGTLKTVLENHYLIEHPNVIITPHIAFNTHEAMRRILDTTMANIKSMKSGSPQNVVNGD